MSSPRPKSKIPDFKPRENIAAPASGPASALAVGPGSPFFKRRAFVYAAGFAVITISGTLIGATIKSREQAEEKQKTSVERKVEVDIGQQVAVLEETKLNLLQRKHQLERKIAEVREKRVKEEEMVIQREELRRQSDEIKKQMTLARRRDG